MDRKIKKAALIISLVFVLSGCGAANTTEGIQSAQDQGGQATASNRNTTDGQANQAALTTQATQPADETVPGNSVKGGTYSSTGAAVKPGRTVGNTSQGAIQKKDGSMAKIETADLMGEVSAISGSEITVKVIKMPTAGQGGPGGNGTRPDDRTSPGAIDKGQAPAGGNGQAPANDPGQGKTSGGNPGNGQQPQRNIQYTGETKVLKISGSVSITKTVRGDNGMTTQAVKVSDIKAGDILQVYYSDKSKGTISKIVLGMGMWGGRQQNQQPAAASKS